MNTPVLTPVVEEQSGAQIRFESILRAILGVSIGSINIMDDGTGFTDPKVQRLWENFCSHLT